MKTDATHIRGGRRVGTLLLAVLQLAASVVLPGVDGALDVEVFLAEEHIESADQDACEHRHDHAFCQVVRAVGLARPSERTDVVRLPRSLALTRTPARSDGPAPPVDLLRGSSAPRAPPLA